MLRWVVLDRRSYSLTASFEFNAFIFFAWMVFVPYYLLKTRGPRGLINALGVSLLAAVPHTTRTVFSIVRKH